MASGNQSPFEGMRPTVLLGNRGSPDRQDQHWAGQLDEVGVYSAALSATDVQALYRGGRGWYGRPDPDLVAGWHFDEGQGTTVRDYRLRQLTYRDPQQAVLQQHGYRYDHVGNITNWWQQDRHVGPWRWNATYDERDRLTGASVRTSPTGVPAAFAYTYDAIGNITKGPLGAYTYGDPAHVHAATAAGTTHTYTYDANGAVLSRTEGATTYTHGYDVQGRQTSVAVAGGSTSTFRYNGDGALVARQVAGRTVAHYAAGGLYEQDPATNTTRKYATFGGRRVAVSTTTTTPATTTVQYLHQDHLGSTGLVTTASGAFAQARFHAPFGAPWYAPTTAGIAPTLGTRFGEPWPVAGTQQAAPDATDYRYTGQRSFEASLGSLYHYQARWYSPVLGRFLSPDPIVPEPGNPQAFNRYSYVYNNPYKYTDPSGYDPLDQEWRDAFYERYGRHAKWYDEMIRLFVLAGLGDESQFYDEHGKYRGDKVLRDVFQDADGRSWERLPEALERLAQHYEPDETTEFVHDLTALFAGWRTRGETSEVSGIPIPSLIALLRTMAEWRSPHPNVFLEEGTAAWTEGQVTGNVQHWAGFVALGYVAGWERGAATNYIREVVTSPLDIDWQDVAMGTMAAVMGHSLREQGLRDVGQRLRDTVPIW